MYFNPGYNEPIEEFDCVRDLGVLIDADGSFLSHRLMVQKKTMIKCSWILRTFRSRDPDLLKTLWRSLAQPIQDYASQVWSPVGRSGEIAWQEKPLRLLTRRMTGMKKLNYWQRLSTLKMLSTERRTERYKILYLWKSLLGMVPDIGIRIATQEESRLGLTVRVPEKSGSRELVQTLKDQFFTTHGPRLFNSLPKSIRVWGSSLEMFKVKLDMFLMVIPDQPVLAGYQSYNPARNGRNSNSIVDWVRNNPALQLWSPDINPIEQSGGETL